MIVSASSALAVLGPALGLAARGSRRGSEYFDGISLGVVLGFAALVGIPSALNEAGLLGLAGVPLGVLGGSALQHRELSRTTGSWLLTGFLVLFLSATASSTDSLSLMGHKLVAGLTLIHFVLRGATLGTAIATLSVLAGAPLLANWLSLSTLALPEGLAPLLSTTGLGLMIRCMLVAPNPVQACAHSHGNSHGHAHNESHDHAHGHSHGHAHSDSHGHAHGHSRGHAHSHGHAHGHQHGRWADAVTLPSTLGALTALLFFLGYLLLAEGTAHPTIGVILNTLGVLTLESAPALVLGYAIAGLVPQLLSARSVGRLAQGSSFGQALRGVIFGLPLPVCSCGVLPIYESLARRGVPLAAGLAFFVATPELGLDAVLLSVPMLGMPLTIARVISAGIVALLVGVLVGKLRARQPSAISHRADDSSVGSLRERLSRGLKFGFIDMFDHTMPWIAFGLLLAAIAEPLLSHESLSQLPPELQVPFAALIGVPLYVCASGATPLVAMGIHKGLSAGAALAFLIAGPATNVTTFGVLTKLHGRSLAVAFGAAVTILAMIAGWTTNLLSVSAEPVLAQHPHLDGSIIQWASLFGLGLLTLGSLFRQGPRGILRQLLEPIHSH